MTIPAFILSGSVNINTPQQNSGVFIGQVNIGGWDANMKFQASKSGEFGSFNLTASFNFLDDNFDFIDGVVNDQDIKTAYGINL